MINNIDVISKIDDDQDFKKMINIVHGDGDYPEDHFVFNKLLKYLQHDTYEYIPIKFFIDVEDPIIKRKIKKLVKILETTKTPEQFYLNKRELDYDAYFAEGYGLTMNEEQEKKRKIYFQKKILKNLKNF